MKKGRRPELESILLETIEARAGELAVDHVKLSSHQTDRNLAEKHRMYRNLILEKLIGEVRQVK